ncbi:gamma-glutamylcyclotransferase [Tepidibacillus sp. LV47]|uniref:gamma-glutamylcyclotransferase n=1 Tax=Tepidibacillus sp. LV47 TaxID=3398228 RepID=UPI003AB03757
MTNKVFVYGTLREGEVNHDLIQLYVKSVKKATMKGWMVNVGHYPAVVTGSGIVKGELIELTNPEEAFRVMDELEEYYGKNSKLNYYERIKTTVITDEGKKEDCEVYVFPEREKEDLTRKYPLIVNGDWKRRNQKTHILYFAYGSCMSRNSFREDVPEFEVIGRAVLENYQVAFTRYSDQRKGGVADILYTPGSVMEGVLYLVPTEYLKNLDAREGATAKNLAYQRITVHVKIDGIELPVYTYEVVNKSDKEIAPSDEYMGLIIDGSDLLSEEYRKVLMEKMVDLRKE